MGPIIVLILRLIVPLSIFRWPILGGIISLVIDAQDQTILRYFGLGDNIFLNHLFTADYQRIDKFLDMYYLAFEFLVSLKWQEKLAKTTSKILFVWRVIGVALFEITGLRYILFIFPNIFENFFLFFLIIQNYFPKIKITAKNLPLILILLGAPKIGQEYLLHISGDFSFYNEIKGFLLKFFEIK